MDNHDLEVDNYNLDDLLELFNLDYTFDKEDLKKAKNICLKTHPDKSGLEAKYFIFYKSAYKIISEIYYFRKKKEDPNTEYIVEENKFEKKLLDKFTKKGDFNKWFNEMFEKVKIDDEEHDRGYEEWFRSKHDVIEERKIPFHQFEKEFYKKKKENRTLINIEDIQDISPNSGFSLTRDKIEEYSSDIFSKLKYEDLKKAHTQTVIPVTKDDLARHPQFKDVESYKRYRAKNKISPLSIEEANRFLADKADKNEKYNMKRAFKLHKQDEEMKKARNQWWKYVKQLEN